MALAWLARLQAVFAAGVLIWLAAALGLAARDGFEPARDRYVAPPPTGAGAAQIIRQYLPPRAPGAIAVLGRALAADGGPAPLEEVFERLAGQGLELRRCEPSTLYAAAEGASLLCVAGGGEQDLRLDWERLRGALARPIVLDFTTRVSSADADAAGVEVMNLGRAVWPAWLDPEFELFVAHVREVIPDAEAEDARILLLAGQPYRTAATRSRWFLMLNYALAPRRIYLWNPVEASGYVMQYFGWVGAVNRPDAWQGVQYLRMNDRALTRLRDSTSAPTRPLSPEELAAAEALGAQWVLLQTPNPDFRLVDWELLPLERARSWSERQR